MATIVTKNSSTASAVPTTSDLVQGELAVNVTDKRIFTENASTQIVELGTNPSSITTATATVTGTLTANGTFASSNAVITGGSVNSTPIGATTPSTIVGSTVTANTGFVGGLTGNVTGNLTGNVTGNVNGNLTGNVTGNVTASSGTTTLNDLVVNGTADFTNTKLTNITTPTVGTDAANKSYVDDTVAAVIDSAPAALDTLNELAAALGDDANFAGTVTTALATKLPLAGGTMTGAIAMGTSKITGLGNPTSAQDAATKTYVDTADALKLNLTGGTMSGAIAMGTNKITGVGNPTLAQDAATKDYVDDILGSATSAATSAAAAATSASNAATSASNAATSATASANSAAAAAASYDAFDDRYLGDKASDPTLDNDGNALLTGALYFNTTSDVMKVYDGSAWNIAAISSASPTFTGTVTADGLSLGDNDKATFGAGNDLEIYHDGSNSFIRDAGTGNLVIRGTNLNLQKDGGESYITMVADGAVTAFYDNAAKLATTATGIDVTGTATMDGLTVDGSAAFNLGAGEEVSIYRSTDYAVLRLGASSTDHWSFQEAGTNSLYIGSIDSGTAVNHIKLDNNGDISFYEDTGTTPKFFWDASEESLGIGTSSPSSSHALDVIGDIRIANSTPRLQMVDTDTSDTWYIDGGSNTLIFQNNANERMRIDTSGNFLVGTTDAAPGVADTNVGVALNSGRVFASAEADYALNLNRNTSDGDIARFRKDGTTVGSIGVDFSDNLFISGNSTHAGIIFGTSQVVPYQNGNTVHNVIDLGSSTTKFKDAYLSGNVHIADNTNIPDAALHIEKAAPQIRLQLNGNSGYNTIESVTGNELAFGRSGSEAMRIDTSGNVGIGTSSPTQPLDVNGNVIFRIASATTSRTLAFTTSNGVDGWTIGNGITASANQFVIYSNTAGAARLLINSSGNIGIGTTTPNADLELGGTGEVLRLSGSSTNAYIRNTDGTTNQWYIGSGGNAGLQHYIYAAQPMTFHTSGLERLRIDASGNVGIGTSSPVTALEISTDGTDQLTLNRADASISTNNTLAGIVVSADDPTANRSGAKIGFTAGDNWTTNYFPTNIIFSNDAAGTMTERMRIASSGNVGIGTSSPDVGLHVAKTGTSAYLKTERVGNSVMFLGSQSTENVITSRDSASGGRPLVFTVGTSEAMRIDSSGNLLVGRTSTITFSTNTTDGIVLSPSRIDISAASLCRISQLRDSTGTYDRFYNGASIVGSITGTTSATAYNTSSDQRLKENITDAEDAGSKVDAIQVRQFDWKADGSHQDYGMVAQELMTVAPEAVSGDPESDEMMGVDYSKLVPMLIKEIQSLRNRVATLEGN
jgi:hypothetical protein